MRELIGAHQQREVANRHVAKISLGKIDRRDKLVREYTFNHKIHHATVKRGVRPRFRAGHIGGHLKIVAIIHSVADAQRFVTRRIVELDIAQFVAILTISEKRNFG